jgi:hypothetical protein
MSQSKWTQIREGIAGAATIAAAFLTAFLQSRRARWGASDDELQRDLPGDELVPGSAAGYTHAITIRAPAAGVWPWLVQIGQDRAGFYSYELLENLMGCNIHNADRIVPEFQHRELGDQVTMHPKNATPYVVAGIEPKRALILQIRADTQTGQRFELSDPLPDPYLNQSWLFFLDPLDERTTRLISRSRNDFTPSLTNRLVYGFFGVISVIMDIKMLQGIQARAEAAVSH